MGGLRSLLKVMVWCWHVRRFTSTALPAGLAAAIGCSGGGLRRPSTTARIPIPCNAHLSPRGSGGCPPESLAPDELSPSRAEFLLSGGGYGFTRLDSLLSLLSGPPRPDSRVTCIRNCPAGGVRLSSSPPQKRPAPGENTSSCPEPAPPLEPPAIDVLASPRPGSLAPDKLAPSRAEYLLSGPGGGSAPPLEPPALEVLASPRPESLAPDELAPSRAEFLLSGEGYGFTSIGALPLSLLSGGGYGFTRLDSLLSLLSGPPRPDSLVPGLLLSGGGYEPSPPPPDPDTLLGGVRSSRPRADPEFLLLPEASSSRPVPDPLLGGVRSSRPRADPEFLLLPEASSSRPVPDPLLFDPLDIFTLLRCVGLLGLLNQSGPGLNWDHGGPRAGKAHETCDTLWKHFVRPTAVRPAIWDASCLIPHTQRLPRCRLSPASRTSSRTETRYSNGMRARQRPESGLNITRDFGRADSMEDEIVTAAGRTESTSSDLHGPATERSV
ncbi:hypothetical protein AXG93_1988s1020 [Marchantia polymorpha subsp. ruderalis]|uniref:Uncharacterized protein n=1 Tax=Marchantia polymorpha subsp. ruderalis TaxID=1480154 RepID=A0A176VVG0_MARPO|nr:hypothetical protein AXG93_1988s1020 [Marchantia polymorpha subsp. ruderalis]